MAKPRTGTVKEGAPTNDCPWSTARTGAKTYIVDGKMTRGFAFLAYPVEYAASGVMSFIVDQDGIVYQKDLGPNTGNSAKALSVYDPDKTWERVE